MSNDASIRARAERLEGETRNRFKTVALVANSQGEAAPADANRLAITICFSTTPGATSFTTVNVGNGATLIAVDSLSIYRGRVTLRYEDFGPALLGRITLDCRVSDSTFDVCELLNR